MKKEKNKAFTRTCIACNSKKDKYDLLRITCTKNNEISIDLKQVLSGRGTYLCYNLECLDKAIKTKRLERKLKTVMEEKFYEDIRGVIIGKEEAENSKDIKKNGGEK